MRQAHQITARWRDETGDHTYYNSATEVGRTESDHTARQDDHTTVGLWVSNASLEKSTLGSRRATISTDYSINLDSANINTLKDKIARSELDSLPTPCIRHQQVIRARQG